MRIMTKKANGKCSEQAQETRVPDGVRDAVLRHPDIASRAVPGMAEIRLIATDGHSDGGGFTPDAVKGAEAVLPMQMLTMCHDEHEQLNVSPSVTGTSKPRFGNVTASRKWLRVDDSGSINYITVSCMRSNPQAWLCRHDSAGCHPHIGSSL